MTPIRLIKQMFPFEKHYLLTWLFSVVVRSISISNIICIAALQQEGTQTTVSSAPLRIPSTAVQTCWYVLPPTWMCVLRDSSIPHNPPFFPPPLLWIPPSCSLFFSPDSGQRDSCCVMRVIVLILPFSQHFNLFMLLPNLYWAIICILYMITFPLPVVWQLWGLHSHAGLRNTCSYFDTDL